QFADIFAISQLSPGPNVLIVTLIGYSVAGILGALAATLAMCGPTAILAHYVSRLLARSSTSRWPIIIQAALVPISIGLMAATAPRMFAGLLLALGFGVMIMGLVSEGSHIARYNWRGPFFVSLAILSFAITIRPLGLVLSAFASFMIAAIGSPETKWMEAVIV